jgi:hypothetical protein
MRSAPVATDGARVGELRRPLVTGLLLAFAAVAHADAPQPAAGQRCEIAVVNPVSNFAECVKPRGAHVDPPPKRATPSEEECRRHPDLEVEGCRQYAVPPAAAPEA